MPGLKLAERHPLQPLENRQLLDPKFGDSRSKATRTKPISEPDTHRQHGGQIFILSHNILAQVRDGRMEWGVGLAREVGKQHSADIYDNSGKLVQIGQLPNAIKSRNS